MSGSYDELFDESRAKDRYYDRYCRDITKGELKNAARWNDYEVCYGEEGEDVHS